MASENRLAQLLTSGDPYGYGNPDEGQPPVKEVGSQGALADYLAAFGAGLVDPWGLTGYGLRGLSAVSPNTIDPNTANQLAGMSSSMQDKSRVAAGMSSMLVPGVVGGRLVGLTAREALSPHWIGPMMGIGSGIGSIADVFAGPRRGGGAPTANERNALDR